MTCSYCGYPSEPWERGLHPECVTAWRIDRAFALIPPDQRAILERLLAERDQVAPA